MAFHDEIRNGRKPFNDIPLPPVPKNNSGWSLKSGRTFSFGANKKQLPTVPAESTESEMEAAGRARSKTASTTTTSTTATPPTLNGQEFDLDLGGDFSNMFKGSGFDKRASTMTLRQRQQQQQHEQMGSDDRPALAPRSLTGNRLNQPSPIHIDRTTKVDESPYSWNSQHSGDQLISASPSHSPTNENAPPPIPKHISPLPSRLARASTDIGLKRSSAVFGRRRSTEPEEAEDEDARLLTQSVAASKFLANPPPPPPVPSSGRYRRGEDRLGPIRQASGETRTSRFDIKDEDDSLFDTSLAHSTKVAQRYISRRPSPPHNKVMTPAQFEKYRQDKERQDTTPANKDASDDEDVNYEDDEDEVEKSKQMAKQRRKQEANMAVYRQQMMKVTGESNPRPSLPGSVSSPNLMLSVTPPAPSGPDNSDDDEEVPLAILAAHGFPNKNRPPNRLSSMMSNPNLRASMAGPNIQRPESAMESSGNAPGGKLPPFARRLPQDPYGLVNSSVRESMQMGGGSAAPAGLPPGGLVGVIANEERTRAMRRGSPKIDIQAHGGQGSVGPGYDPVSGIPPQMMYPQQPTSDMNQQMQQMQQFMQMQMQFMNMMTTQQTMVAGMGNGMRGNGHLVTNSMGDIQRRSFLDPGAGYESVRGEAGMRTMSMVQPSSASFYGQPMGSAPSVHIQGQYAASIAPSERSNIGLPGRYRPVSHMPAPAEPIIQQRRASAMSGALGAGNSAHSGPDVSRPAAKPTNDDDDDEEKGWEQMKAKRDRRRSLWKSKKSFGAELSALIS